MHYLMTISNIPKMLFQCKCFLDSLKNSSYEFTLVINNYRNSNSNNLLYEDTTEAVQFKKILGYDVEILFSPIPHSLHPPVRWFVNPRSDFCVFVDSDVLMCSDIDSKEINEIKKFDISGLIAHENIENWDEVFNVFNVKNRSKNYRTTKTKEPCPFYINYGVVFVNSNLMCEIKNILDLNLKKLMKSKFKSSHYVGQIALAVTLADLNLNLNSLPLRFNYPDSPNYDSHLEELHNIRFFHYLYSKNIFSSYNKLLKDKEYFKKRNLNLVHDIIEKRILKKCKIL